nr:MAG TPA: protein of unknown function (DUF5320) [Caudoviricetes sp.]
MRKGRFMELLPLDFYSLTQAVEFINQKTNSTIKENLLYSYAMEGKIRFLLNIEIKDNQLVKIGRMDTGGFFISKDSELFFRETALKDEKGDFLSLSDRFSLLNVDKKEDLEQRKDDLFLSFNNSKVKSFKGYIVFHPELLDLFCKDSLPIHYLRNTSYLDLSEFDFQSLNDADIFCSFNFKMNKFFRMESEHSQNYHPFKINFSDIKISYNDLIKLIPSSPPSTFDDLEQEIKKLKSELEEKDKKITELQTALDDKNIPILLGVHRNDDPLKIAIEVRNKYWASYPDNVKSNTQIRDYIIRDYRVTKTFATEIEKIACPIDRKKN